jgi:hypothetical protein
MLDGDVKNPIEVYDSKEGTAEGISLSKHIKLQLAYSIGQLQKVKKLL